MRRKSRRATTPQLMFESEKGDLKAGQRILIHGGSGVVGSYAIQFAKNAGAEVAATCSAGKMDYVAGLGADVVIDYRAEDFQQALKDWSGDGLDTVFDLVCYGSLPMGLDLLRPGGSLVSIYTITGDGDIEGDMRIAAERGLRKVVAGTNNDTVAPEQEKILALLESGAVKKPPFEVWPLEQIAQAAQLVMEGKVFVKMLLKIAELEA